MQFGWGSARVPLNVNSDPFHASWAASAATLRLPAIILLGFPSTAEMSEHGSKEKDRLLLSPTSKFLDFAIHCEPMNYPFWSEMGS